MVTAFYKVFNEADFLKESLTNIYPFVDRIVMMEYCFESMRQVILPDRVTSRGLSVDGTTEIIKKFPDPDKKIEHWDIGFLNCGEEVPYQMVVDGIDVGDFAWVIDGDIVYDTWFAEKIKYWIDSDLYDCIWIPERVFYHDFWHEKHAWYFEHQRVFRKQSKYSFYFPNNWEVNWIDPVTRVVYNYIRNPEKPEHITFNGKLMNYRFCNKETEFAYHYAFVKTIQRTLEKMLWQYNMIDYKWNNERERNSCKMFHDPLEFKINTHDYFLNHEQFSIAKFDKSQPSIMKNNKWYKYRWDEQPIQISYEKALKLVKWEGIC